MRVFLLTICMMSIGAPTFAQPQPPAPRAPRPAAAPAEPPTPAPTAPVARSAPRREGQPVNVKVEVSITDQRGGAQALKKTVTVVTGDQMSGFVRSTANYSSAGNVPLNVDTQPEILPDGKIRVHVNLQYDLPGASAGRAGDAEVAGAGALRVTAIQENLSLILENGKPLIAAQSADPVGDRQVTIEVKATIMR
jgi:hypothetical protein